MLTEGLAVNKLVIVIFGLLTVSSVFLSGDTWGHFPNIETPSVRLVHLTQAVDFGCRLANK